MSQIKVTSYIRNPIQDIPNPWMYGLPSGSFADMIPLRFSLTVPYWQRLYFIPQIFLFLLFFRQSETGHLPYTIPIRRSARSFAGNHTRPYRVGRRTSRTKQRALRRRNHAAYHITAAATCKTGQRIGGKAKLA